jgi:hypothetical protein
MNVAWTSLLSLEASRKKELSQFIREARDQIRLEFSNAANSCSEEIHKLSLKLAKMDGIFEYA